MIFRPVSSSREPMVLTKTKDVIIGKGFLDVAGMFKALKEVKFPKEGALSLEFEGNPDDPIADIKQCLAVAAGRTQFP